MFVKAVCTGDEGRNLNNPDFVELIFARSSSHMALVVKDIVIIQNSEKLHYH